MLASSVSSFPDCAGTATDTGLPFGCVAQPLVELPPSAHADVDAEAIGRCERCGAYVNAHCNLMRREWCCSLCNHLSPLGKRYGGPVSRRDLDELREAAFEAAFVGEYEGGEECSPPVYIAVVDTAGGDDFLEVVRAGLHAAIAALPPDALLGLLTFSDSIGVHVLGAAHPHVRHLPIPIDGEPLPLVDAVPMERMLVHMDGPGRERAGAAIEALGRSSDVASGSAARVRQCALGSALRALCDALGSVPTLSPANVLVMLGTRPNYALGALPDAKADAPADDSAAPAAAARAAAAVYDQLAHDYACLGAAIFLYSLGSESAPSLGLEVLQPLVARTGGVLNHYAHLADCMLTEDVYKQLARPYASQCVLRVRTCPELTVSRVYGPAVADKAMEQLYYLAGCHEETSIAFGFEFTTANGFAEVHDACATVQLAFTYTAIVPLDGEEEDDEPEQLADGAADSAAGGGGALVRAPPKPLRWVRVRRLRVDTLRLPIATSMRQLYESVDDRVVIALLTHKVIVAIQREGFREGRLLLQDWLIALLAKYQFHYQAHPDSLLRPESMCEPIAHLPAWVYGLLRGPLLASNTPLSAHALTADVRTWTATLYQSLPAADLTRAIMPTLDGYASAHKRSVRHLPLEWLSMVQSGCSLFVLDAYTDVYIYAMRPSARRPPADGAGADGGGADGGALDPDEEPFPPSKSSALWAHVTKLKQQRLRTARVLCCRAGVDEPHARRFESYIDGASGAAAAESEEPSDEGDAESGGGTRAAFSYGQFLSFLHAEVRKSPKG